MPSARRDQASRRPISRSPSRTGQQRIQIVMRRLWRRGAMLGGERLRASFVAAVNAPELRAGRLSQRRRQLAVGDAAGGDHGDLQGHGGGSFAREAAVETLWSFGAEHDRLARRYFQLGDGRARKRLLPTVEMMGLLAATNVLDGSTRSLGIRQGIEGEADVWRTTQQACNPHCLPHSTGNPFIIPGSVAHSGCRPPMLASTTSGASSVRRSTRER